MRVTRVIPVVLLAACMASGLAAHAAELTPAITPDVIDLAHCAAFVDGNPAGPPAADAISGALGLSASAALWSTGPRVGQSRQFRVAFNAPITLGTVVTPDYPGIDKEPLKPATGDFISILKPDAAFPGDVTNDAEWIYLSAGAVKYLPAGVKVRAIRFSSISDSQETKPRDVHLGRALFFKQRYYDATDLGHVKHVANQGEAEALVGGWNTAQAVAGAVIFESTPSPVEMDVMKSDVAKLASEAVRADWDHGTALPAAAIVLAPLPVPAVTHAVKIIGPTMTNHTSLETVVILVPLGERVESPGIEPEAPVRIPYTMPMSGFIALDIHDKKTGKRVRRLIGEIARDKGPVLEPWDLKDDTGTIVPPGDYTWKAIARPPFKLTYEMTAYNAGIPGWWAPPPAKGGGGWLADHTPPNSVAQGGDRMWISAPVAESGHSLIATDLDGVKEWGCGMFPFGFDGPKSVTADDQFGYAMNTASLWRIDPNHEFAMRPVFNVPNPAPADQPWGHNDGAVDLSNNGIAAHNGKVYVAINAPSPSWLSASFTADQMDIQHSQPLITLRKGKGHRNGRTDPAYDFYEYDELMQVYAAFMMTKMPAVTNSLPNESLINTAAAVFGDAPDTGAYARSLVLALTAPATIGSIVVPDGGIKVWALKDGKTLKGVGDTELTDVDLGGGGDTADAGGNDDDWIQLKVVGRPGSPAIALAPEGGIKTTALRYQAKRMKFSLAMPRRFDDAAPEAARSGAEGEASPQGGWEVKRQNRVISEQAPASMALVWPAEQSLHGVILFQPTPSRGTTEPGLIAVDVWTGPAADDPAQALDKNALWRQVGMASVDGQVVYPLDFGEMARTRALRIRFLTCEAVGAGVYRAGISAIMAMRSLGGDPEGLPADQSQRIAVLKLPAADDKTGMALLEKNILLPHPTQVAFAPDGTLYAVSAGQVVTVPLADGEKSRVVVSREKLEVPVGLACDAKGMIYVTDNGPKIIKVFDPAGALSRTVGTPGGFKPGKWDPNRMVNPAGIAVDKLGRLWMADLTYVPKRIQRFTPDGKPEKAFFGPTQYGGGGTMDSRDRRIIYYSGMKFLLDWDKRTWTLDSVLGMDVERTVYYKDQRYLIGPIHGGGVAFIAQDKDGVGVPMAAMGELGAWSDINTRPDLQKAFGSLDGKNHLFVWYDKNGDGIPEADEVQVIESNQDRTTWTVGEDLSFLELGAVLRPTGVLPTGVPTYDLAKLQTWTTFVHGPGACTNSIWGDDKGRIFMIGTRLIDSDLKTKLWEYYNQWAMHDGFYAAAYGYNRPPGVLNQEHFPIGHIHVKDAQGVDEEYYITNSDESDFFCYTADGMLVGCLMGGPAGYGKKYWSMPEWEPGKVDLSDLRPGQEHYQGCVVHTDGHVYIIAGHNHMSVVRADGLEDLQRLNGEITVTPDDVLKTQAWQLQEATLTTARQEPRVLRVPMLDKPLEVAGSMDKWPESLIVTISETVEHGLHNSNTLVDAEGALAYDQDNLYVAIRARSDRPFHNSAQEPPMAFKGGDAAEISIGMDPNADPHRMAPVVGDMRIILTNINGNPTAVLYKPIDPNAPADKHIVFTSPVGKQPMDRVEVIQDAKVAFGTTALKGKSTKLVNMWVVEAAIPWKSLGVTAPTTGSRLRGDLGVLQADENGMRTVNRLYWSGKTQTVVADIPSESRLAPSLWGEFDFVEDNNSMKFSSETPDDPGMP